MHRCDEALRVTTEASKLGGSLIELRRRAWDGRIGGNSDICPAVENEYIGGQAILRRGNRTHWREEDMAKSSDVILVHGAWADGSSWAKVIPLLAARGHSVTAVQLPPDVSQRRRGDG
jgi:hypothetical protein